MMPNSRISICATTLLALGVSASFAGAVYSGTALSIDSASKVGVVVSLKRGDAVLATTTTSATGAWSLEEPASVLRRADRPVGQGGLRLDSRGRLRVLLAGRDLSGRTCAAAPKALPSTSHAARAFSADPDTLVYSEGERVLLRDTVSADRSGMTRIVDTSWNAAIVYGYLRDTVDGKVYRTVKIGSQVWMAENLARKVDSSWNFTDKDSLGRRYGRLYHWSAAMATTPNYQSSFGAFDLPRQGVCPAGWHLPSDTEWSALYTAADSTVAGPILKATAFPSANDTSSVDAFGFRVLPGGLLSYNTSAFRNVFLTLNTTATFWSSSEIGPTKSGGRNFSTAYNYGYRTNALKTEGRSVRCVAD